MEKKLGVVTLEQLGQPLTYTNQVRRAPEPIHREQNPSRFHQATGRPSTSETAQPTSIRSKNSKMSYGAAASIARRRHSR